MKEKEFFTIDEQKKYDEYKSFEAKEYHKSYEKVNFQENIIFNEDNTVRKTQTNKDPNTIDFSKKPKPKIKDKIKLSINSSLNVATTLSVVAFASVISAQVFDTNEQVNINSLDVGSNYLVLDLTLDTTNSNNDYFISLDGINFNEVIQINNNSLYEKIDNLNPESKYTLEVYKINNETNNKKIIYEEDIYTKEKSLPYIDFSYNQDYQSFSYVVKIFDVDSFTTNEKIVFTQNDKIIHSAYFEKDTIVNSINALDEDTKVTVYGIYKNKEIVIYEKTIQKPKDTIITSLSSYSDKNTITYQFNAKQQGNYTKQINLYKDEMLVDIIEYTDSATSDKIVLTNNDINKYNIIIKENGYTLYESTTYDFYNSYNKPYIQDNNISYDIINNKLKITINDYIKDDIFTYKVKLIKDNNIISESYFKTDTVYLDITNDNYILVYEIVKNNLSEYIYYDEVFQKELKLKTEGINLSQIDYVSNGVYEITYTFTNTSVYVVDKCIVTVNGIENIINVQEGTHKVVVNTNENEKQIQAKTAITYRYNSYTYDEVYNQINYTVPVIEVTNSYVEMLDTNKIYISITKNKDYEININKIDLNNNETKASYTVENDMYILEATRGINSYRIYYTYDNNIIYSDV